MPNALPSNGFLTAYSAVLAFLVVAVAFLVVNLLVVPFTEIAAPLATWARQLIDMEGVHGGLLLLFAVPVLVALSLKTMVVGSVCSQESARSPTTLCWPVLASTSSKRTRPL